MIRRSHLSLLTLALALPAAARDREPVEGTPEALRAALEAAGWTLTPDRAATYEVGNIYDAERNAPVMFARDCFDQLDLNEGGFTQAEVISAMKAGGRVPLGVARLRAEGMQYKQLTYAEPFVSETSVMQLEQPTAACVAYLQRKQNEGDISEWFVVQSVLSALVNERVCRELEVGASAAGIGALEGGVSQECVEESEGHVAVAFKVLSVTGLLSGATTAGVAPPPRTIGAVTAVEVPPGFSGSIDIDNELVLQECQDDARDQAPKQRTKRLEAAAATQRRQATESWATLAEKAEECLSLEGSLRPRCVETVREYIAWASGLVVRLEKGHEQVETDCGEIAVAMTEDSLSVSVPELAEAEAMLARLKEGRAVGEQQGHGSRVVWWVIDGVLVVGGVSAVVSGSLLAADLERDVTSGIETEWFIAESRLEIANLVKGVGIGGLVAAGGLGLGLVVIPTSSGSAIVGVAMRF